jgi:ketosteroid isomerase-like protein
VAGENVELVRRAYGTLDDAYRSGEVDLAPVKEMWDPDCVIKPSGLFPESREMHGHEGIVRFATAQMEAFDQMWSERQEFIEVQDRVVVPFRFGGRARHTGIEVEFSLVHVWTVRDGKLARVDMYATKAEALEAVGLPE